jgi:hypothetical protein
MTKARRANVGGLAEVIAATTAVATATATAVVAMAATAGAIRRNRIAVGSARATTTTAATSRRRRCIAPFAIAQARIHILFRTSMTRRLATTVVATWKEQVATSAFRSRSVSTAHLTAPRKTSRRAPRMQALAAPRQHYSTR